MISRASSLTLVIIALCLVVQAAYAWDFTLLAVSSGTYQRTYTLTNNSAVIDVSAWTLHWNPTDWMDDITQGAANFDSATGVIPPIPSGWYQVPAIFPWFSATNSQYVIQRNGGSKSGFIVRYGTTSNPNPVFPQAFTITYMDGNTQKTSEMMPVTDYAVPEPTALLVFASGVLGLAALRKQL